MAVPIDITKAQSYLKADGDDNDLIADMLLSATVMCQDYCNRVFYPDQATADTDFAQALADRTAALAAQKTSLAGVDMTTLDGIGTSWLITDRYGSQLAAINGRINGIVLDDAINAAILITLGHLYVNREDNVATGNNVVQVPVGAQRILQSKLWIGDLVGTSTTQSDCCTPPVDGS